ncbi:unnamed protein product [Linum trigynum]|uniref:Uncharacterized protein n=1 Tax=Linum trigynum TaxID=586398 RepID=A0AAV2E787_9ROSI
MIFLERQLGDEKQIKTGNGNAATTPALLRLTMRLANSRTEIEQPNYGKFRRRSCHDLVRLKAWVTAANTAYERKKLRRVGGKASD